MSVAWVSVGVAAVGTVASMDAAGDANDANNRAIDAQEKAADKQAHLAQEQWDFQKNTYLPKAMQQADEQLAMSKQLTDAQLRNSDYNLELSKENMAQAKKSWEFQDMAMQTARDYSSGAVGNAEAGRANADVEQGFTNAAGALQRSASRMGLNPGSGAFASAMGDVYTQKALAGAGAQTNARLAARNKAEGLVAQAAGAGTAGFGTGMQAGSLATSGLSGAAQTNGAALNGLNSVAATYGTGMGSAGSLFGSSNQSWNSAAGNAQASPSAGYWGGLTTGALNTLGRTGFSGWGTSGSGLSTKGYSGDPASADFMGPT